jgi:molybdopterin-guanine dinucleotide biosynthesis protein A
MMETDCLLALAVDMPFVTVPHLKELCDFAKLGMGAVPRVNGKVEPLMAVYPKDAASVFAEALNGTDHSVQQVVRRLTALDLVRELLITGDAARFYRSINYPTDLEP